MRGQSWKRHCFLFLCVQRKTDSVYCSISLSVFHSLLICFFSLLIFFWGNRKKPKIFIMCTWIITSHFKKSNEKCKILINIYKTKLVNNITKSSLKILPPPPRKKFNTDNVIYNRLHFLVLYLYNLIQNRHWHIKFKTYYIRIRKTFSLFVNKRWMERDDLMERDLWITKLIILAKKLSVDDLRILYNHAQRLLLSSKNE